MVGRSALGAACREGFKMLHGVLLCSALGGWNGADHSGGVSWAQLGCAASMPRRSAGTRWGAAIEYEDLISLLRAGPCNGLCEHTPPVVLGHHSQMWQPGTKAMLRTGVLRTLHHVCGCTQRVEWHVNLLHPNEREITLFFSSDGRWKARGLGPLGTIHPACVQRLGWKEAPHSRSILYPLLL